MRYAYTITDGQAHDLRFVGDKYTPQPGEIVVNGDILPDISTLHDASYTLQLQMKAAIDALQEIMDKQAQAYGYDNVFTAVSYTESTDPTFRKEGLSFLAWRDAMWIYGRTIREKVLLGEPPFASVDEFVASAPAFEIIEEEV